METYELRKIADSISRAIALDGADAYKDAVYNLAASYAKSEREKARKDLLSDLENFMRPATHASGAQGLPRTSDVIDWEYYITKSGWEAFKKSLLSEPQQPVSE